MLPSQALLLLCHLDNDLAIIQVSKKTPFLGHGACKQKSVFKKALEWF
jgi:hypothetical protein